MSPHQPITIVSGLPRSGTSLMMQMVVAAGIPALTDGARSADDDNPRGYYELEAVKHTRADPAWVEHARGKVAKVIHALLPDLPPGYPYRIILMDRDLDEVIASQRTMLQRSGRPGADLAPEALKRAFAAQLAAARRWIASHPEIRHLEVSYNRILESPAEQARRVAAFLDLPQAADRMTAAIDGTLYRNRAR